MAVIAAMTAQNTLGVSAVAEVSPHFVAQQLDAVLIDIPPDATKTGMLLTADVIDVRCSESKTVRHNKPGSGSVMVSTSARRC